MCTRPSRGEPFGKPVNLGPGVNSASADGAPALSADGRTLCFASDRPGGQGDVDLWLVPIEPPGAAFSLPGKPAPPLAVAPFDAEQAKKHQQTWADYLGLPVEREIDLPGGVKMTMVLIPPGEFTMGSSEAERQWALQEAKAANDKWTIEKIPTEAPEHRLKITRPFYLGKYEVTQAQWEAVMGSNPSKFAGPSNPVEQVSWDDIQPFLAKLNAAVGWDKRSAGPPDSGAPDGGPALRLSHPTSRMKYALPTEAQWEYACRAGTTTAFCFGDDRATLGQYGWFTSNSGGKTHPVGGLKANAWGLYDVHGNVWEWCADWWDPGDCAQSPMSDPPGPAAGSSRVRRGGSSNRHPGSCRSAIRYSGTPGYRECRLGFRLALVPAEE